MSNMLTALCRRVFSGPAACDSRSLYAGHLRVTYRGIEAIRCPFDYVLYQMIISRLTPDLVIEVGTHRGGGALYLADLMDALGNGMVHTIDVTRQSADIVRSHPRIKLFSDGWERYDLREADGFQKVLVIEDSSHEYENTLGVLRKFGPVVTPGSYLIVEDGIVASLGMGEQYHGGPLRAVREYLAANPAFVVDRTWCDFFGKNATFNVDGYLQRL